jgi:choline dehydrogenase-like flavoprotein
MDPSRVHVVQEETYDAIVVGSGITGGWAAKELTEKGAETLVLERGPMVEHGDYPTESTRPWEADFRGRADRQKMQRDHYVQSQAGPVNTHNVHFFANDRKNPYTHDDDTPFLWIRGHQVGGRSLTWGRQCYRWSDLDFTANARDGHGVDWPLRYDDLAPWYDYVEGFVGVSGREEGVPHVPDGNFLPPMEMNCVERVVKDGIERHFPDRLMTIGRVANLTEPHEGRGACQYRNICSRGCSYGAYFSTQSATLPAARATGNLTLRPNSIVHSVIYDGETGRATGVRVIDRETEEALEFRGRLVFLCASALGSTQILLNSTSARFPDGLANSSGALGHYLMDHPFKVGAQAEFPDVEGTYYGRRPTGTYIPRFRNLRDPSTRHPDFQRGYAVYGYGGQPSWRRGISGTEFGASLKNELQTPGPWQINLMGLLEMLPREENYVELDPEVTDDWGIPVLRIRCTTSDNAAAMREDVKTSTAEMLAAAGGQNVTTYDLPFTPGEGIHEMGTARMGRDPDTSVLNKWNQAHDVPNLFVTDGACMTSAACQNPSITYMALTARAVDYAVKQVNRGEL